MDELERFIKDNREQMDVEPPAGHADRFRKRVERSNRKNFIRSIRPLLRIAGVILLVSLSTLWVLEHTGVLSRNAKAERPEVYEYQETEQYYTSLIHAKLSSLETMHFLGDSTQKQILYRELGDMDSLYSELQKELKMNPGDERLVQAMTEYYEIKLDVINHIIRQLSALQTHNTKHHETKTM